MFQQQASTGNSFTAQLAREVAAASSPLTPEVTASDFLGAGMPSSDRGQSVAAEIAGAEFGVMPENARFLDESTSFKDVVMAMAAA